MNLIDDLLSPEERNLYNIIIRPFQVQVLRKALDKRLEKDPNYEVFLPLSYHRYKPSLPIGGEEIVDIPTMLISNKGRVRLTKNKGRFAKIQISSSGYLTFFGFRLHRAMACLFIPRKETLVKIPMTELVVNHIDGDKTNVELSNLEWVTPSENNYHASENDLMVIRYIRGEVLRGEHKGFVFYLKGAKHIIQNGFSTESVYRTISGEYQFHNGCGFSVVNKEQALQLERGVPENIQRDLKKLNYRVKSPIEATDLKTGKSFLITGGEQEIRSLGFLPSGVSMSISGSQPFHKGHSFKRVPY